MKTNSYKRIPFGAEEYDASGDRDTCYDCGVRIGEYHTPSCDEELCPKCRRIDGKRGQIISCGCFSDWTDGVFVLGIGEEDDDE